MKQSEIVAAIKEQFPAYSAPLDSAVRYSLRTGVRRTAECQRLYDEVIGKPKKRKPCDTDIVKITARVPKEFVNWIEFKKKLRACGYASVNAWVMQCIKRQEAEYAARQKKTAPVLEHRSGSGEVNESKT